MRPTATWSRCISEVSSAVRGDAVSNVETVARADQLWPDEVFQRSGRLFQAMRVAVTPGEPVIVTARPIDAAGGPSEQMSIAAGELLRMVPA